MKELPHNFELLETTDANDETVRLSELRNTDAHRPWQLGWGPAYFDAIVSLALILASASHGLLQGLVMAASIAIAHVLPIVVWRGYRTRHPRGWSERMLGEQWSSLQSAIHAFQFHCGQYRQWALEVSLRLRPCDDAAADRYYALLEHAHRVLVGAIQYYRFLCQQVERGFRFEPCAAGQDARTIVPLLLMLRLEAIQRGSIAHPALAADPMRTLDYEEAIRDVSERLDAARTK